VKESFTKKNQFIHLPLIFSYIAVGMHIISKNNLIIFFKSDFPRTIRKPITYTLRKTQHIIPSIHAMLCAYILSTTLRSFLYSVPHLLRFIGFSFSPT